MVDDTPSTPTKNGEGNPPSPQKNGGADAHRYDVGPGFEIAVRSEGKHGVEVNLTKDADAEHRHLGLTRRIDTLERTVADLEYRLSKVESAARPALTSK